MQPSARVVTSEKHGPSFFLEDAPTSWFQPLVYSLVGGDAVPEKDRRHEDEGGKLDNLGVREDKDGRPFILIRSKPIVEDQRRAPCCLLSYRHLIGRRD